MTAFDGYPSAGSTLEVCGYTRARRSGTGWVGVSRVGYG